MTANVQGLVARGKLTEDKANKALTMLKGVLDYSEFKNVDMVIEVGCLIFLFDLVLKLTVSNLGCFASVCKLGYSGLKFTFGFHVCSYFLLLIYLGFYNFERSYG